MEHYHGGAEEWVACLPLQNKLRELLCGVSEQMLAEDGITVASYMAGTDDTGASLCPRKVSKWAAAAQDRFAGTILKTQFETAPALLPSAVPQRSSRGCPSVLRPR